MVKINAAEVTLRGFTISGCNGSIWDVGVRLVNSPKCIIEYNNVSNNGKGIYLFAGSNNVSITNNIVTQNRYGAIGVQEPCNDTMVTRNNVSYNGGGIGCIYGSKRTHIEHNYVAHNGISGITLSGLNNSVLNNTILSNDDWGIKINCASDSLIQGNSIISHSHEAMLILYSSNIQILSNEIMNCSSGIYIDDLVDYPSTIPLPDNYVVANNVISLCTKDGIHADYDVDNSFIQNNTISLCGRYGISSSSETSIIANNTISSCNVSGIWLMGTGCFNNVVSANNISHCENGLSVELGWNNTIDGNDIVGNTNGILIDRGDQGNTFSNNRLYGNGIVHHWYIVEQKVNYFDSTNLVNGKPLYYIRDQVGGIVPDDAGQIILVNCSDMVVEDQNIFDAEGIDAVFSTNITIRNCNLSSNNHDGLHLYSSTHSEIYGNAASYNAYSGININHTSKYNRIHNNTVAHNSRGLSFDASSTYNVAANNMVTNNGFGFFLNQSSHYNVIYNNDFLNNNLHAYDMCNSTWNLSTPIGGNFFDGWTMSDANHDGFVDSIYVIPEGRNEDHLPLTRDSDWDNVSDFDDAFPTNPNEWNDTDGDNVGDNSDAFPNDPDEWNDSDNDSVGNNADAFPEDPDEWNDTDGDGMGDNSDAFVDDPAASKDTDEDGFPDEWNTGMNQTNSTTNLTLDAFPNDANETTDTDNDGAGDNSDAFPNDSTETTDTDNDGVGDNADAFPNDATETLDTDGDGVGDNADAFPLDAFKSMETTPKNNTMLYLLALVAIAGIAGAVVILRLKKKPDIPTGTKETENTPPEEETEE